MSDPRHPNQPENSPPPSGQQFHPPNASEDDRSPDPAEAPPYHPPQQELPAGNDQPPYGYPPNQQPSWPPAPHGMPQAGNYQPVWFMPLRNIGGGLRIMLIIMAVLSGMTLPIELIRGSVAAVANAILSVVTILVFIPTAIMFLVWTYQAYRNLLAFQTRGLTLTPGWLVAVFFIPILGIYRPYQGFVELWKASDPQRDSTNPASWRAAPGEATIMQWWLVWILSGIVGWVAVASAPHNGAGGAPAADPIGAGLNDLLTCVSALLLVRVVRLITERQEAKFYRPAAGAPQGPYGY